MLRKPSFRTLLLPLALALLAFVALNIGLYTRLIKMPGGDSAAAAPLSLPFFDDFSTAESSDYAVWGGDWEIRDESYVQMSTTGFDLGTVAPLKLPTNQAYRFTARMHYLGGNMGGGLLFNVQQGTSRQKSQMARFNVDNGKLYVIYGYFGDDSNFVGQGSVELPFDTASENWYEMGVVVGASSYAITLDDAVLAVNIPLQYQGGSVGLVASSSQVAFDDLSVTATDAATIPTVANPPRLTGAETTAAVTTAEVDPNTFTQLFADTFASDTAGNPNWNPFSGTWGFEPQAFVQTDTSGFDFSAASVNTYRNPMRLRVTLRHREGVGGGVLFNMPQPNSKNGAYMVRYIDQNTLTWGYFDATGVFVGQGGATVPEPGTETHTLEVLTGTNSYDITLDKTSVAQNVPLGSSGGYIGLTTSQSAVAFTSVQVEGVEAGVTAVATAEITGEPTAELTAEPTAEPTAEAVTSASTTDINLIQLTGTWTNDGKALRQTDDVQSDAVAGVGIAAANFRVSVDITLPEGLDNAGGGVVFHMQGRDTLAGGTLVRFSQDGSQVFWGAYDEQQTFKGAGSSPVTLTAGQPHNLTLVVRASQYDILVDDQMIASSVPLSSERGWIGLVSFRGPVEFHNFALTLSE